MYSKLRLSHPLFVIYTLILQIALLQVVDAQNADSLTIEMSVTMALENHPSITQAQQAITTAQAHTRSLRSTFFPGVNATVNYANIGPDEPIKFLNYAEMRFFPANNFDGHVTVDYLAYDFGKRQNTVVAGKISEEQALDRLENAKQMLAYQVILLFNSIILLQQSIPVKDDEIEALNRHLQTVRKKVETGSATEFDILKTEGQLANSQSLRLDMVNDLNRKQIALRQLLSIKQNSPLNLKSETLHEDLPVNTDSLIAVAIQKRAEHRLAEHSKIAAQIQMDAVRLENRPTLGLRATAGVKNGIMPDIEKPSLNWNVGALVSIPVFDGNKRKDHLQEVESSVKTASVGIAVIESQITTDVLQAAADIEAALSRIALSEKQVKLAEQSLTLARLQYDAGTSINENVLDAETEFSRVKFVHLQNQQRYTISLYSLQQATGSIPGLQ
jgi:outer membrane protein TolC